VHVSSACVQISVLVLRCHALQCLVGGAPASVVKGWSLQKNACPLEASFFWYALPQGAQRRSLLNLEGQQLLRSVVGDASCEEHVIIIEAISFNNPQISEELISRHEENSFFRLYIDAKDAHT